MSEFRETPYGVFNYLVNLGDGSEGEIQAGFSEVSGLNAEVTVAEYRAGNAKVNYVTKIPAIHKAGDVTLNVITSYSIHYTKLYDVRKQFSRREALHYVRESLEQFQTGHGKIFG